MVARLPDSEPRMLPRNLNWRAYQLADDPESAVMIALSGSLGDRSANSFIGLIGSADTSASIAMVSHQRATFFSIFSRQDRSDLRSIIGISARSVAAASPTRLTSLG